MANRASSLTRQVAAWLLSMCACVSLFFVAASTASAEPAKFWGVDPIALPTTDQFQRLHGGGVDSVRFGINWHAIEKNQGQEPDWSGVDAMVTGIASAGMEGLPFITGAPDWAVPTVSVNAASDSSAPLHLPVRTGAEKSAWKTFVQTAAQRYGPNGTFWQAHPGVPVRPIRTWQIWNEPNFKYFVARPNPVEYGKLVKVSYTALKSVDSGAKIVLGGLFVHPKEGEDKYKKRKPRTAYFATEFLDQFYRSTPGIKTKFQGIALHPYTPSYNRLTPDIEEVRKVLAKYKDAGKGIWITELGWSSEKPSVENGNNQFEKGSQGQVKQLKGAFKLLEKNQRKWHIQRVYWFSVDDDASVCNFCDGSGLFGPGFTPKPSWPAFVKFAGGTP